MKKYQVVIHNWNIDEHVHILTTLNKEEAEIIANGYDDPDNMIFADVLESDIDF